VTIVEEEEEMGIEMAMEEKMEEIETITKDKLLFLETLSLSPWQNL